MRIRLGAGRESVAQQGVAVCDILRYAVCRAPTSTNFEHDVTSQGAPATRRDDDKSHHLTALRERLQRVAHVERRSGKLRWAEMIIDNSQI